MGFWDFVKKIFSSDGPGQSEGSGPAAAPTREAEPEASYAPPDILAASPEEHRRRALQAKPWQSAWNNRFDIIPPAGDERTALVDRGLVLAGKATAEELDELHAIGDEYLKYHQRDVLARVSADRAGAAAVEGLREDRAARKARKKAEAVARRRAHDAAVAERRATDIIYLGRGVSRGLADRRANLERLEAKGLPKLATPADVAAFLELPVPELRWLAFFAEAAERTHYIPFEIPKRRGGHRKLAAPHAKLKAVQRKILRQILERLEVDAPAHGFVRGRSTVSNADCHIGRAVVVCLDLKDFFPTITFARVRGLLEQLGYSPAAATVLGLLCTEAPRIPITYDGTTYQVAVSEPALPQGAPTSPTLSNLICRRLDRRLAGFSRERGFTYTRYADDLTFSADEAQAGQVPRVIRMAQRVARDEGFEVHPAKTRVMRKGRRQLVTGVVVNEKRSVPREEIRQLRALLHNAKSTGLDAQNRTGVPRFRDHVSGKIAYISMIDPEKGRRLKAALDALA